MSTTYRCRHCHNPVGMWHWGWKHQTGGHSKPSCGRTLTNDDIEPRREQ